MSSDDFLKQLGHIVVGGYYDHQSVRTQMMNRIRDIIRKRNEGIPLNQVEAKKEKKKYDKKYSDKQLPKLIEEMRKNNKLSEDEYSYIRRILDAVSKAHNYELSYKSFMQQYIKTEPLYTKWLSKIRGLGPVLSSDLLHIIGYCDGKYPDGREKVPTISSLWHYCGLHVVNGKAPKREKGKKIDWNDDARTLAWNIANSFIRKRTKPYRQVYDSEKKRQLSLMDSNAPNAPDSLKHAELRARRKVAKIFLAHYWLVARRIKGLPVTKPYAFDRLNHQHEIPPPFWDDNT
jgi:hypothetical protein